MWEWGRLLHTFLLLGAGIPLQAPQFLPLLAAVTGALDPAALLLRFLPSQGGYVPLLARPSLCQAT